MACSGPYCLLPMVLVLGPGRSHHGAGAHLPVRRRGVAAHDMRAVHVAHAMHCESETVFPAALSDSQVRQVQNQP